VHVVDEMRGVKAQEPLFLRGLHADGFAIDRAVHFLKFKSMRSIACNRLQPPPPPPPPPLLPPPLLQRAPSVPCRGFGILDSGGVARLRNQYWITLLNLTSLEGRSFRLGGSTLPSFQSRPILDGL
jgi:hypothetical protein